MMIYMINGAVGLDRWGHVVFQHHNVDQSRFHRLRAPIVVACGDDHPVKILIFGVVGDDVQMG